MSVKAVSRGPAQRLGRIFGVGVVVATVLVAASLTTALFPWSLAGRGGGPLATARTDPTAPAAATLPADNTLELVAGGSGRVLGPSSTISLGPDLRGQISLAHPRGSPYVRDLDVALDQTSGAPLTGANVVASARMASMDMGTIREVATPAAPGHYRLEIPFAMPGEWQIDLQVTTPTGPQTATLHLFVWT
jgi:hypothetical protein